MYDSFVSIVSAVSAKACHFIGSPSGSPNRFSLHQEVLLGILVLG